MNPAAIRRINEGRTVRGRSPVAGRLMLEVTQRLRGSQSLALLRQIEGEPQVTREEALARQWRKLSALLAHAEANVPYYREMFRTLGVTSRDVKSLKDFAQLPILTKDIIRERGSDMIADGVAVESLIKHHSGGSTGVPLTFYHDPSYVDASDAGTYRNLRQSGWQPGEMIAFFWGWGESLRRMPHWQFELRQMLRRTYQFNPFQSGPNDMQRWVVRWKTLNARVALGYASTIARFAEYVAATGQSVAPLRGVFTTAEKLLPQHRAVISRVFNCKVYDCYGSSEVRHIASECPRGSMHVNCDYVVLEEDRRSTPPDQPAPFLLTSLLSYSMPFIRYRNEDCGRLIEGECPCGGGFPLMELDIARVRDDFILPGDKVVHAGFFTYLMYGSEGIANFQFHQTAPAAITLWVVPGPGSAEARARVLRTAAEKINALAGTEIALDVREVEQIPLSSAGKHCYTRSDVPRPSLGNVAH